MSIWSDIHKRSNGKSIRKEDENIDDEHIACLPTFIGLINQDNLTNISRVAGHIYYVTDDCTADGNYFHKGDLIIDSGNEWKTIYADYYIGQ